MANGWGGARPGFGTQAGIEAPFCPRSRRESRWQAEKIEAKEDSIARARAWLEVHEDAILNTVLEKGDPGVLVEVWKTIKAYAEGPPRQRTEVSIGPSPTEILMQIAERRGAAIPAQILPPDA